jgi:hypothetical protein
VTVSGASSVGGPLRLLWRDSAGGEEDPRHDRAEDESADMREERDATAAAVGGMDQRAVALEVPQSQAITRWTSAEYLREFMIRHLLVCVRVDK